MSVGKDVLAIETEAAHWVAAYSDRESWTEQQQIELDAWLSADVCHEVAYLRLLALWKSADRLAVLARPMRPPAASGTTGRLFPYARVAAIVAAATGIAAVSYFSTASPNIRTYQTPVGGRETIALKDGTSIELNTNTELRTQLSAGGRAVTLVRGEAFFDVRHDKNHPFIVHAGGHRITDIGTQFLVRADSGRVEVSLIKGRAQFDFSDAQSNTPPTVLTPGDVAIVTSSALSVTHRSKSSLDEQSSWRRGILVFDRTTLADAAAEVNRYSSKKLVVVDPRAAALTIGGTFPTGNVRMIAEAVQDFYGLKFEDRGDEIVISR